nr:glycosyltransferase [Marinicella sp. W31]MDC2875960.1 glycosyltransferase [Marinicella sp. W31]
MFCPADQAHLIKDEKVNIITFDHYQRGAAGLLTLFRHWRRITARDHYDIIHLHSSFAGLVGRIMRSGSAKIVYCPHGWAHAMTASTLKKSVYQVTERYLAMNTDLIINISKSEAALARQAWIPEDKCRLIYNGIADMPWSPVPEKENYRKLLFVGRFDRQKGIDTLLKAMTGLSHDGFSLDVIGGSVVGRTEEFVFPSYVTNHGWQSAEAVSAAMAACDIVVMPSRWEGFSIVALEAMRAGRPIAATAVSSLHEAIADGKTGAICKPESPAALEEAIRRIANGNPREMGISARQRFETLFQAQTMFDALDAAYHDITASNQGAK